MSAENKEIDEKKNFIVSNVTEHLKIKGVSISEKVQLLAIGTLCGTHLPSKKKSKPMPRGAGISEQVTGARTRPIPNSQREARESRLSGRIGVHEVVDVDFERPDFVVRENPGTPASSFRISGNSIWAAEPSSFTNTTTDLRGGIDPVEERPAEDLHHLRSRYLEKSNRIRRTTEIIGGGADTLTNRSLLGIYIGEAAQLRRRLIVAINDKVRNLNIQIESEHSTATQYRLAANNVNLPVDTRRMFRGQFDSVLNNIGALERVRNNLRTEVDQLEEGQPREQTNQISQASVEEEKVEDTTSTIEEKLVNAYQHYRSYTGYYPSIIEGYIIGDKVYDNNEDIINDFQMTPLSRLTKVIVRVYSREDDKFSSKIIVVNNVHQSITKDLFELVPLFFKLRIRSSKDSGDVFGLAKEKKVLEGEYVQDWTIRAVSPKKLNKGTKCIILNNSAGKELKFLFSDCELTKKYKFSAKGFFISVDKTIKVNSIVSINSKKSSRYIKDTNEEAVVLSIKVNPSSKKISKDSRNHRMDIVTIKLQSGKILTVYAQDLNYIRTDKKHESNSVKESKKSSAYQHFEAEVTASLRESLEEFLRSSRASQATTSF